MQKQPPRPPRLAAESNRSANRTEYPRLPPHLRLARTDVLALSSASLFCRKQAHCASLFKEGIEEVEPGKFVLKSPFKESFLGSLHLYEYPNAEFTPIDTIAQALLRHAEWFLNVERIDSIRSKFKNEPEITLDPPCRYWDVWGTDDGDLGGEPSEDGSPALLGFRELS